MNKVYVIGIGKCCVPELTQKLIDSGIDYEVIQIDSMDEIVTDDLREDDVVMNVEDRWGHEDKYNEVVMNLRAMEEWCPDIDEKKLRKIERRRENRSKKDRRNHR